MLTTRYTDQLHADTPNNGGATVDLYSRTLASPSPEAGSYYVGGGSWCVEIPVDAFTSQVPVSLITVARASGHRYLGTWVNDGTVYVEPTTIVPSREEAARLAAERGEKAFYDAATGTEVPTPRLRRTSGLDTPPWVVAALTESLR